MQFKPLKQINWMEISGLLVGALFTVAIMIFAAVLYAKIISTGVVGIEEYKLHSTFDKALGLRPGTRVQITGVDVGQISGMTIISNGVSMEFTIRKEFQNWITDSAEVYAIRDQNVISARVINIDIRRGKGRVLQDGDYLAPGKAQDIETVLETTNELLGRVNKLIDAADTLLDMAMDTGTTVGALFGSRQLYDNLNRQLFRLDDITYTGKITLLQAATLMDTLKSSVPVLLNKVDTIADDVGNIMGDLKNVPDHVNSILYKLDTTVGRVDGMVDNIGTVSTSLTDFISSSEETLENADELMNGISNMWLIRRSIPNKDTVPFMVETLW